jgi:hypothetical protein
MLPFFSALYATQVSKMICNFTLYRIDDIKAVKDAVAAARAAEKKRTHGRRGSTDASNGGVDGSVDVVAAAGAECEARLLQQRNAEAGAYAAAAADLKRRFEDTLPPLPPTPRGSDFFTPCREDSAVVDAYVVQMLFDVSSVFHVCFFVFFALCAHK